MTFIPRNKLSVPPEPGLSDEDRAALRSLVNHAGLYVLLDIVQRMAIEAEIQVYTELAGFQDDAATLQQVSTARMAWLMLDRIQVPIVRATQEREDAESNTTATDQKVTYPSNDEFLSP